MKPYTVEEVARLAEQGKKRIAVIAPAFSADCIETLEEINDEARETFLESGGEAFHYIPCLNDSPLWTQALADLAERHLQGWDTRAADDEATLALQRERALALGSID